MIRSLLLASLYSCTTVFAAPQRVLVGAVDGTQFDGQLTHITTDGTFEFIVGESRRSVSQDDLTQIVPVRPAETASTSVEGLSVLLANGDQLVAKVVDEKKSLAEGLRLDLGMSNPLLVPLSAIAAIRFGESRPQYENEFNERIRGRTAGRDVLMMLRDGKMAPVPGALDALSNQECSFRINDKVRSLSHGGAYGVILGSVAGSAETLAATVWLSQGSRISAKLLAGDAEQLHLDAGALGKVKLPWRGVTRIEFQSGRVVFLSDLEPDIRETRGLMDAAWPVQLDKNIAGKPLSLRGRTFVRGLGVHAECAVTFKIDGQFEHFKTIVGIDDDVAPAGSVIFRVKVDGRTQFESAIIRGTDEPLPVSVDISGGQKLTLEADMADDLDISDQADWANAILIRKK